MESLRVVDVMKVLAPECKIKTIGIRPGEKLHEQLVTEHEARRCHDIGSMYVILSDFKAWATKDSFVKKKLLPKDMEYISNNPKLLLSPEHVKRVLRVKV